MKSKVAYVAISAALVLGACVKDGVLPSKVQKEGPVELMVELVSGVSPFDMARGYLDGAGNSIRFTTLRFYLSNVHLQDPDSNMIGGGPAKLLLLDGSVPSTRHDLGMIPNGHIEEVRFSSGLDQYNACDQVFPPSHPLADPLMQCADGNGRLHMLMEGFVDINGNGVFDAVEDVLFDYRPSGPAASLSRHFHMHADMVEGKPLTLSLRVDVLILLLGLDLKTQPRALGDAPQGAALVSNLALAVSPL